MTLNCLECGKLLEKNRKKYCSLKCSNKYNNKRKKKTGIKYEYDQIYNTKIRSKVFFHYGGNPPKCAICGFDNSLALEIDHINNDGCKHRKEIGTSTGRNIHLWLIKNNFPKGFQILCANCNKIKYYNFMNYKRSINKNYTSNNKRKTISTSWIVHLSNNKISLYNLNSRTKQFDKIFRKYYKKNSSKIYQSLNTVKNIRKFLHFNGILMKLNP